MRNLKSLFKNLPLPYLERKVGIALSGGSTYGAAHVGVMQILEQNGIHPQLIAGTSAGALVGAAYCAGVPLNEIETLFLSMRWPTLLKLSIRNRLSIFDTQPMEEFLRKELGDIEFKDLKIPFAAIACDIHTGERVVLDSGPVAPAVRASAAIPGLFSPVEIGGRLLVDGGIVDNLPVEQLRSMGADYVIASDVSRRGASNKNLKTPLKFFLRAPISCRQEPPSRKKINANATSVHGSRNIPPGGSKIHPAWLKQDGKLHRQFCPN